ncbi:hypothetical protein M422DRAFT_269070 [Sphaerobolus stellatus SS14]|uniref:CCHC-type domain-containing protein n=1 Tax=Sphaerobolus stellatus (strain SS14) TaxID=990650 RepID=A0A0C9UL48_SPHS4|nr:hypothetical protein M422DRAFT_269070 [Sphaerobolus stellatus SS14]
MSATIARGLNFMCRGCRNAPSPSETTCETSRALGRDILSPIERSRKSIREPQSIDMNALREEIKETISSVIRDKLCSDVDSVTTVSQSISALETNAQYWNNLSNKAARQSCHALELQVKLAEEKVNNLLHEEAPEQMLLDAAQEAQALCFQLDQNTRIREAGLAPEQQVRFRTDRRDNMDGISGTTGARPHTEVSTARSEAVEPSQRQSTPAWSMTAQLDEAVVNRTTEYSGIQNMVRQAVAAALHEDEPEKSLLAKAGVKLGNPPVYNGERNLEKFENWVASVLQFMSLYNLLGPKAAKVQIQLLRQCLSGEAQEWFYRHWFMPTLSLNKVAVKDDNITQGSMTVQQLHQELSKLAKQMIELPDADSYRRRFMSALKPDIRESVLEECLTPEFTPIGELVEEAVKVDNAKCYTTGYNTNHRSSTNARTNTANHNHGQHNTTQHKSSSGQNAGSSNQHHSGNIPVQNRQTNQVLSARGGDVRTVPAQARNPVPERQGGAVNRPTQSNPNRNAPTTNNSIVCLNCNQPGHIRPNCPFPDKDRRVSGARIEEVILEEDEGQNGEFDLDEPHPEERQEVDDNIVRINAIIKDAGYNDHRRLYGIRVQKAETELRVSAVGQTGEKTQPVYDHQARKRAQHLPPRGKENETISLFWVIAGTKAHCLLDSGCEGIMMSNDFVRANKLPKFELDKPVILQLACVGSKSTVQYGLTAKILIGNEKHDEYFDIANVDYYDVILGTPFLRRFGILLDFKGNCVKMGKYTFPNKFGSITPTEADEEEDNLRQGKPKTVPGSTSN